MGINIITCIKSVINQAVKGKYVRAVANSSLNPFDIPAVQMAVSLKQKHGGSVTILTMGPESAKYAIYDAMSMGADKGILLCDKAMAGSDTFVTSTILGTAITKIKNYDLVLFGTRTLDSDTGHVGPQTAQMLDLPFLTNILDLSQNGAIYNIERKADGYIEKYELQGPAAFTINLDFSDNKNTTLYEIQNTFENKDIEIWDNSSLSLDNSLTGLNASPTKIIALNRVKKEKSCKFLKGSPEKMAETLVDKLTNQGFIG
jgi:electron transfer flavoprotein beta subunit